MLSIRFWFLTARAGLSGQNTRMAKARTRKLNVPQEKERMREKMKIVVELNLDAWTTISKALIIVGSIAKKNCG